MNQFTTVKNELFEELYKLNLSGAEFKVYVFILRHTVCFHRMKAGLSSSYIAKGTDLNERTVKRALKQLTEQDLIIITNDGTHRKNVELVTNFVKTSGQMTPRTSDSLTPRTSGQMTPQEIEKEKYKKEIEKEEKNFSWEEILEMQESEEFED